MSDVASSHPNQPRRAQVPLSFLQNCLLSSSGQLDCGNSTGNSYCLSEILSRTQERINELCLMKQSLENFRLEFP